MTQDGDEVRSGLDALVRRQADSDDITWPESMRHGAGRLRHVSLHVAITAGRLARIVEQVEHGSVADDDMMRSVAADLVIHAAQLAEWLGVPLGDMYESRSARNVVEKSLRGGEAPTV